MLPKLTFYGGVGTATGANISLEFNHTKIMVDCGLLQGLPEAEMENFKPFAYDPSRFDFLFITHAHLDHIGKAPKLVKEGFKGKIISTKATKDIAEPILTDALKVMQNRFPGRVLFEESDMMKTLSLWEGCDYGEEISAGECKVRFSNAGHILGSAIINVDCGGKKFVFTGDLGNFPSPLLPDPETPAGCDYLVMESVYGDRNHESKKERDDKFKEILEKAISRGGEIVIPAFSLERTQVMLFELNNLVEKGEIPSIPVFLDSPLASKVTEIYKKHSNQFKESVREQMDKDDIFDFPRLSIIKNFEESQSISSVKGSKIIIAGSGMSEGGRVINHEARILNKVEDTLILVGYQPVGMFGRKLKEGAVKTKCNIESIEGFSSHMDSDHLIEFVEKTARFGKLKKVFVIMGETKSSLFLVQRIRDYLGVEAVYPEPCPREYILS